MSNEDVSRLLGRRDVHVHAHLQDCETKVDFVRTLKSESSTQSRSENEKLTTNEH